VTAAGAAAAPPAGPPGAPRRRPTSLPPFPGPAFPSSQRRLQGVAPVVCKAAVDFIRAEYGEAAIRALDANFATLSRDAPFSDGSRQRERFPDGVSSFMAELPGRTRYWILRYFGVAVTPAVVKDAGKRILLVSIMEDLALICLLFSQERCTPRVVDHLTKTVVPRFMNACVVLLGPYQPSQFSKMIKVRPRIGVPSISLVRPAHRHP